MIFRTIIRVAERWCGAKKLQQVQKGEEAELVVVVVVVLVEREEKGRARETDRVKKREVKDVLQGVHRRSMLTEWL